MDMDLSPVTHQDYLVSVSYDKSLNLYSLDKSTKNKLLFSYHESNLDRGFFTHVRFLPTDKNILNFIAVTSNGYILLFSNGDKFEPIQMQIYKEMITALDVGANKLVICSTKNEKSKIFIDDSFRLFVEFDHDDFRASNLKLIKINRFGNGTNIVFAGCTDNNVYIWNFNQSDK